MDLLNLISLLGGVFFFLGFIWIPKTSDDVVMAGHINDLQDKKVDTDFHDTFILLTDTPAAYAGQASKFLKVNATPDALIFATIAWGDVAKAGSNLTDLATRQHAGLSDAPADAHHPQLHAAEHLLAGGDAIKLDDLAAPDDNTDLDFSTTKHGLVPKGTDAGNFLKDDGTWAAGGGGAATFLDLTDTPAAYAGEAGKFVRVNATPDALEFVTHDKALHDALAINADQVDGEEAAAIVTKARVDAVLLTIVGSGALAKDHGAAATDMLVNVCYGTGTPPTANLTTIGTIWLKYT